MSQNKDSQNNDFNNQKMASYAEMSQSQLMAKLTDDSTSPEELEKIMDFLTAKDSEAQQKRMEIETHLKEQESDPQLGKELTGMHNAMDGMRKATTEYVKNDEERNKKWDLVRAGYMPAIDEMCEIYKARRDLLFSVKEGLVDTADKLLPKVELDETKDPWEEMGRFNKEVEDTEAEFRKEMEKVSNFTKAYHEMPEYKELTEKLEAIKERIAVMEVEFNSIMATDDRDMVNVADAMKIVDESGKNL
tara:strand:+ start:130 stop:870 length:741 start_codon:yes stop_codon:yes gene_type:complete